MPEQILSILGTLFLMILVFAAAYFVSKWLAKGFPGGGLQRTGSRIRVLDRAMLGKDQSLMIVKADGRVYLLGVTSQQITKLDELDPEDYLADPAGGAGGADFKSVLQGRLSEWAGSTGWFGKKRGEGEDDGGEE